MPKPAVSAATPNPRARSNSPTTCIMHRRYFNHTLYLESFRHRGCLGISWNDASSLQIGASAGFQALPWARIMVSPSVSTSSNRSQHQPIPFHRELMGSYWKFMGFSGY
jgi:hypothetical protein